MNIMPVYCECGVEVVSESVNVHKDSGKVCCDGVNWDCSFVWGSINEMFKAC